MRPPQESSLEKPKMYFVINGFSEEQGARVFAFEGITADHVRLKRIPFTVSIDLALARKYGIRLQELPLLCWSVLERGHEDQEKRAFTYKEEDMRLHAQLFAARDEAAKHAKPGTFP